MSGSQFVKKRLLSILGISSFLLPATIFLIIAMLLITILGAVVGGSQSGSSVIGGGAVSDDVMAYEPLIDKYCEQNEIPEYASLVLAVMQLESGGTGGDPMQCSESPGNLKYPNVPGGITDPEYSIDVGVQYLASCLRAAGSKSPQDIPGISLALQGYNFGGGYISWAQANGGYTPANAAAFSQMKAQQMGWSRYGDPNYVTHVLRYYAAAGVTGSGTLIPPLLNGTYTISRGFGYQDGKLHKGIDFAAPAGTKIYASASGTVVYAGFGILGSGFGGYGNVILLKHDNTYSTLYAHCSRLLVSTGQTVTEGSVIALVGSTGDSTGNHCHYELRISGEAVDSMPYLNGSTKIQ